MIKNFTFQFYLKKMFRTDGIKPKSKFINDALSDSYGPSSATVKNIMAYSDAYRTEKTESMGNVEFIIN
jgi:hypothetical protein